MLLHKWCPFLMRTMSPLAVGLIFFYLIGVSSVSPQSQIHQHRPSHLPSRSLLKLKRNAIHSSFAKDYTNFTETKSTETPRVSVKVSNTSKSVRNPGFRTKPTPNLNLSLKLKVRNGSETNSTIIYLPRLSRSMTNFTRNSVNASLQPIIVSTHRRVLLDPKQYTIRSDSRTRDLTKLKKPSLSRTNPKQNISRNVTATTPRKLGLRTSESTQKSFRTFLAPKSRNAFKPEHPTSHFSSESTVLVNIKSNLKNGSSTKSNSSTLQFLPTANPKILHTRHLQRKHRRQGRNFDLSNFDPEDNQNIGSTALTSSPSLHDTTKLFNNINNSEAPKLFYTNHNTSSSDGNSSYPDHLSLSQSEAEIKLSDLGYSYAEKKAKNLTIYEILKPRLKSSSNISEVFDFSPDQSALLLKNDAASHQIKDVEDENSTNSSMVIVSETEEIENNTFVTNGIEFETPKNVKSVLIVPGRSDSAYGIEYVMINRNKSEVISSVNTTENDGGKPLRNYLESNRTEINLIKLSEPIPSDTDLDTSKTGDNQKQGREIPEKSIVPTIFPEQNEKNNKDESSVLRKANSTARLNTSEENLSADGSEYRTQLYESDSARKAKMTENANSENVPFKSPKIDSKMFYDYFAKKPIGNVTLQDFPYLEYRPGNMFRYSDVYQRKPVLDVVATRSPPILRMTRLGEDTVTEETVLNPTTFNSLRTSVRVLSTYYPNRMQDVTMKFGNRIESTTVPGDKKQDFRNEDDPDDAEYRDSVDPGFTMEKLAYLLIGTCCGLSILCLFVVVIAIKCRRALVEKRLKAQFRKRMYAHERMKDMATPWQQQMFDHFMYLHRRPGDSSCSSNTDSCNCRCVTWSLGARNLDATRPLCPPTGRGSLYLYGPKKLPFGAASTLRFESMLGRKRTSPENNQQKNDSPNTDSSHENDSLDLDSDSREGDAHKQCTCIDYNVWTMPPPNVPRGFYSLCPNPGRYNSGNCSQHPPVELRTIARDVPPPVTGSNYLDRSEGVVYWSSNEERLI